MLGISTNNLYVFLKYLGSLHNHLIIKVMLFKPKVVIKLVCKHSIWRIWTRIKDNQVVPIKNH